MNNFMISAKRFITNKNTVTIIGVLIVLIILYWGYKSTIDSAVNPVSVPVAANLIEPQTEITASDIAWINVPSVSKSSNVLTNTNDIIGKYTAINATIPEGSMFYSDVLVTKDELPGTWLEKLKTDANGVTDLPYYISINIVTSYANSILPDSYIDIYMKAKDDTDTSSDLIIFGKLIENIQVLAVKDASGNDVFSSVESDKTPSYLFFGVPEDMFILLRTATYLSNIGIELIVVPHGGVSPVTGDIEVSSEYLRDYIDAHKVYLPTNSEYLEQLDEEIINNG